MTIIGYALIGGILIVLVLIAKIMWKKRVGDQP